MAWHGLASEAVTQWERSIAHLGLGSVVLAVGYLLAAALCWSGALACRRDREPAGGWVASAGLLALLGVHTLLRLDLLAIFLLRAIARGDGWYDDRRTVQAALLAALVLGALVAAAIAGRRLVTLGLRARMAVAGVSVVTSIAVVRAISLHFTDRVLAVPVAHASAGRLLELAALGLTAAAAVHRVHAA